MRRRWLNSIAIKEAQIPYKWSENLVANGKIGGIMLVFVEGFTEKQINEKVKAIKNLCKQLKEGE